MIFPFESTTSQIFIQPVPLPLEHCDGSSCSSMHCCGPDKQTPAGNFAQPRAGAVAPEHVSCPKGVLNWSDLSLCAARAHGHLSSDDEGDRGHQPDRPIRNG